MVEDLRRLVARIGSEHGAHAVDGPTAGAHALDPPDVATHAPALRPGAGVRADALEPPAAGAARLSTAPATEALGGPAAFAARGRVARLDLAPAAAAPAPALLASPPARAVPPLPVVRAGAVAPTRRPAPHHLKAHPGGVLMTARLPRTPWAELPRERLLAAWALVLREHGHPAEELRLLGVYGPLRAGAVAAARADGAGDAAVVALRRARVPGPISDLALARHVPSGRLLRTISPRSRA